jgi:anaphase-promoting complex subunit 8
MLQLSRIVEHLVGVNSPLRFSAADWSSDIRPQDHRAWFGLGQAYALLTMYRYSLHYYHRALTLKYTPLPLY